MTKTAKTRRVRIVLIVLAVLLALALAGLGLAANYLFHFALDPQMEGGFLDGGPRELTQEEVRLRTLCGDWQLESRDGLDLHALYLPAEEDAHRYVLACHGYGGDALGMVGFCANFHEMGYHILAPDARAHGESGGRYAGMGWPERRDIVDWASALVERDPEAEIVLYGVSMGGATVMMTAGEADLSGHVRCAIEDCGYSSVWDEFSVQLRDLFGLPEFPILNAASLVCRVRAGYGFKEASAAEQLKKTGLPFLFIHGEEDAFVPYSMLDVVYEACASEEKERLSVPGAAHGEAAGTDPELYWATVEAFLGRHMG